MDIHLASFLLLWKDHSRSDHFGAFTHNFAHVFPDRYTSHVRSFRMLLISYGLKGGGRTTLLKNRVQDQSIII